MVKYLTCNVYYFEKKMFEVETLKAVPCSFRETKHLVPSYSSLSLHYCTVTVRPAMGHSRDVFAGCIIQITFN